MGATVLFCLLILEEAGEGAEGGGGGGGGGDGAGWEGAGSQRQGWRWERLTKGEGRGANGEVGGPSSRCSRGLTGVNFVVRQLALVHFSLLW